MNNKTVEAWKDQLSTNKCILVGAQVKIIDPVVSEIVTHLLKIDMIEYIRLTQNDLQASNEIALKGRTKIPISTPDHPTAVGVHLLLDISHKTIQFFAITSAVKGYGERIVNAIVISIPHDWKAVVVMDWSGGFWDKMAEKYDNILIC